MTEFARLHRDLARDIVALALDTAMSEPESLGPARDFHAARSRRFVNGVALGLRARYANDPTVRVLSKHDEKHRHEFGMNELLYDVHVVQIDTVMSARQGKRLAYVTNAIWQVESEFSRSTREAIHDFNKLVAGAAEHKLFIGPTPQDIDAVLRVLAAPARHCTGTVTTVFVPAPADWGAPGTTRAHAWAFVDDGWEAAS